MLMAQLRKVWHLGIPGNAWQVVMGPSSPLLLFVEAECFLLNSPSQTVRTIPLS